MKLPNIFNRGKFGVRTGFLAILLSSVALTGCNDFLDQDVQGNNIDKDFYDTRYKLQSSLNAA